MVPSPREDTQWLSNCELSTASYNHRICVLRWGCLECGGSGGTKVAYPGTGSPGKKNINLQNSGDI